RGRAAPLRPGHRVRRRGLAGRLRRHGTARARAVAAPGPARLPATRTRHGTGAHGQARVAMEIRPAATWKLALTPRGAEIALTAGVAARHDQPRSSRGPEGPGPAKVRQPATARCQRQER